MDTIRISSPKFPEHLYGIADAEHWIYNDYLLNHIFFSLGVLELDQWSAVPYFEYASILPSWEVQLKEAIEFHAKELSEEA